MPGNAEIPPIDDTWMMWPDALRPQDRQRRLGDPERPEEVGLHLGPDLVLGQLLDEPEVPVAGVVDDDVELPEGPVRGLDGREVRLPVGDVELERQDRLAVLLHQVVQGRDVAGRGGHPVAAVERGLGPLAAEAAGRAGDEPCLLRHAGGNHQPGTENSPAVPRTPR